MLHLPPGLRGEGLCLSGRAGEQGPGAAGRGPTTASISGPSRTWRTTPRCATPWRRSRPSWRPRAASPRPCGAATWACELKMKEEAGVTSRCMPPGAGERGRRLCVLRQARQAHDLLGRSLLKCVTFAPHSGAKVPRSACRKPCKARLPGHLIPFEAGGCPLELPRQTRADFVSHRFFNILRGAAVGRAPSVHCSAFVLRPRGRKPAVSTETAGFFLWNVTADRTGIDRGAVHPDLEVAVDAGGAARAARPAICCPLYTLSPTDTVREELWP